MHHNKMIWFVLLLVASCLVPCWSLIWPAYSQMAPNIDKRAMDLLIGATPPYGLSRIAVVYLVCCVPLGLWLGQIVCGKVDPSKRSFVQLISVFVGCLLALAMMYFPIAEIATGLQNQQWQVRHVTRMLMAFVLQFPWVVAASCVLSDPGIERPRSNPAAWIAILLIAPPCYAEHVLQRQTAIYNFFANQSQIVDAWKVTRRLNHYGFTDGEPGSFRAGLNATQSNLMETILQYQAFLSKTSLPPNASAEQRIQRARILSSLGKEYFPEAIETLSVGRFADTHGHAAASLAKIYYLQRNFERAHEYFLKAIQIESAGPEPTFERVIACYQGSADSLRALRRFKDAEQLLKDAIEEFPSGTKELTFLLANHFEHGGRAKDAIREYQKLEDNPMAKSRIDKIMKSSAACIFW